MIFKKIKNEIICIIKKTTQLFANTGGCTKIEREIV